MKESVLQALKLEEEFPIQKIHAVNSSLERQEHFLQ